MVEVVERTTALIALRPGREAAAAALLPGGHPGGLPEVGRFLEAGGLLLARAAPHQVYAMQAGVDRRLMAALAPVANEAGVIDLSDARVGVRVTGPGARARLSYLVPLDLHPSRFGPGQCAQTLMAHLTVLLLQLGPDAYEVQCGRSFAGSFLRAFEVAA